MVNPYFTYILTFSISLLLYLLNWSELYPPITIKLLLFFISGFVIAFYIGAHFQSKKWISYRKIPEISSTGKITIFIYFLWLLEFMYAGGIPLFKILKGETYDYVTFGIPSLHIFVVTFNSFFAIYTFHMFLSSRNKRMLYMYLWLLLPGFLVFNRGMILFNISSSIFVFLLSIPKIEFKTIRKLSFALIIILFLFGVMGNIRLSHSVNEKYNRELILDIAQAEKPFEKSIIPKEFFWTYLYGASPMANLQKNINENKDYKISLKNIFLFANTEILPDFISKRINTILGFSRPAYEKIAPFLTVASIYARSYTYLGWLGLILMALFILFFPFLYLTLLRKKNHCFITGVAVLNTMYFFMIYDNMLSFTGLSFQLIYPLIFPYFFKENTI